MVLLRIEHPVKSFDTWHKAFAADPIDRRGSGVRRYRVMRAADDPACVIIDLELDSRDVAELVLGKLRGLWERVQPIMLGGPPTTRILDIVDAAEV